MAGSSQELLAHLLQLERLLLQPETRRDVDDLTSLLAEDFREFGSSGRVFDRREIVDELAHEPPHLVTLSDPSLQQLGETVALLTYRSTRLASAGLEIQANRSSVWVKRAYGWQIVFHQGTQA